MSSPLSQAVFNQHEGPQQVSPIVGITETSGEKPHIRVGDAIGFVDIEEGRGDGVDLERLNNTFSCIRDQTISTSAQNAD